MNERKTTRTIKTKDGRIIENGKVPMDLLDKSVKSSYYNNAGVLFEIGAAEDLVLLNEAFKARFGRYIPITDGYRSYESQVANKKKWTDAGHPEKAATPGTSNHGWGKAFDFDTSWNGKSGYESETYKWLLANGPSYGWINPVWARKGGSNEEPWHFEYIGNKSRF